MSATFEEHELYCLTCDELARVAHKPLHVRDFDTWLKTHGCDKEQLWYLQNMLGDCYPGSKNHRQAVQAWMDKEEGEHKYNPSRIDTVHNVDVHGKYRATTKEIVTNSCKHDGNEACDQCAHKPTRLEEIPKGWYDMKDEELRQHCRKEFARHLARADRLREALEEILDVWAKTGEDAEKCRDIARRALKDL